MRTLGIADMAIRAGDTEVAVTGGMESMSQAPYLLPGARFGFRMGDVSAIDAMTHDGLTNPFTEKQMINEASEVSNELEITRVDMDRFAERSHRLAAEATDAGRLADEIVGVTVKSRKGETTVEADEAIRPDTTLETLAKLRAIGGDDATHTAGNAPGVNDGAGAIVVASSEWAEREGRTPLARVLSYGTVADDFAYLAKTPANAAKQALEKIGKSPEDVDLWEINEAFASVALNSVRMLGIDEEKVNVNGGAIALGHPIGASGARIVGALVHELGRRGGGLGVAAICSGGGQGDAIVIEVPGPELEPRRGLLRPGQDPDGGVVRDAVRPRRGPARDRRPPPARQLGLRAPALPAARHHRRAHRRGAAGRARADPRRAGEDDRADGAGGDGGDPAARLSRRCSTRSTPTRTPAAPTFIVSAAGNDIVESLARVLGMEGGIGTRYEVDAEGDFTGRFDGPFVYGAGKVEAMRGLRRRARDRPRRFLRLLRLALGPADAARRRQPGRGQPRPAAGRARQAGGLADDALRAPRPPARDRRRTLLAAAVGWAAPASPPAASRFLADGAPRAARDV